MRYSRPPRALRAIRLASAVNVALLLISLVPSSGYAGVHTVNTPPSIAPVSKKSLKLQKGGLPKNYTVAHVSDAETPAGDLVVTLVSSPAFLSVTNIVNTNGTVTADLAATCNAPNGKKNFTLQVTDAANETSQATINVILQANPAPIIGAYGTTTIQVNTSTTITPSAPPSDNGTVDTVGVAITSPAGFTGSVSIDPMTGVITVTNAAPANTYTGTVSATDNCGTVGSQTFTLIVNGTVNQPPVANAGSPQTVDSCAIVALDGTTSSDPDGMPGPLTYAWVQAGGPPVVILADTTPLPSFQAPNVLVSDSLTFQLTVSDGALADSSFVTVTVNQDPNMNAVTEGLYSPTDQAIFLHNCNYYGFGDNTFVYGSAGAVPVTGDYDGDGTDTIGLYFPSTAAFFLRNTNAPGPADETVIYGLANEVPLIGDWDNDGVDTIGIYDPPTGQFFLRNSNTPGPADITFQFGAGGAGVIPLAGDWNGDGTDTIGIYVVSTGVFFLRNSNSGGVADLAFTYGGGGPDVIPLAGNWDGVGGDSVGIYVQSTSAFFLKDTNGFGPADVVYTFGNPGNSFTPIIGNWDGL